MKEVLLFLVLLGALLATFIYITQLVQDTVRVIVFKQQESLGEGALRLILIAVMAILWTIYITFS